MCVKDLIIGLGVGMVLGYMLKEVPMIRKATDDMKNTIENDVVEPIKNFVTNKAETCNCQQE